MYLVVGLGNPGSQYSKTRHNMGFQVVDKLAKKWGVSFDKENFHAVYVKTKFKGEDVIVCKPYTFMNLSGQTVMEITHFFKIPLENIIVIFDDMDTVPGQLRIKERGSSGGQKGIQSIIDMMHSQEIKRIKIGIGRATIPVVDYVLASPSNEDEELISKAQEKACVAIEAIIEHGFNYALSRYNR